MLTQSILILFCLGNCTANQAENLPDFRWGQSVVKIRAESTAGRFSMGSGVVVAPDRVATNCHVTRSARSISVSKGSAVYAVTAQSALLEQDVCILHTLDLKLPAARLGKISAVSQGDEIFVFGFPMAVGLGVVRGVIRKLHALDGDTIIETDAGFMRGTSGGALFSARGDLIALPTFMLNDESGGHFYAVPVEWVSKALSQNALPISALNGLTFWENGRFGKRRDTTE
ncbi:MAG: S1 family peptidase [Methylococcales bacterium]